ncbi:helix-turn-helix domain-containing protein [Lutimonas sp.]|uniref:helix-turn-helix domain-containing protein n=1 Tax=Lutimonas sp. TaxID=1872403 RepID=UPI003D9B1D6A
MQSQLSLIDLFNILFLTGVIYGLIFCTVLFFLKRKTEKPILYLNLQVLFITLNNLQAWLIDMGFISDIVYIKFLRIPWYFMCMPMFYIFLIYYLKLSKKLKPFLTSTLVFFSGFIVARLVLIGYGQLNEYSEDQLRILIMKYGNVEEVIGFLYTLIVFIQSLLIFNRGKEAFKFVLLYDDLTWIKHFFNLAGMIIFIWVIAIIINLNDPLNNSPVVYYPLRLSTTILIYWIGFKGLFRFRIMEDRIELRANIKKGLETTNFESLLNEKEREIDKIQSRKQLELFTKIDSLVQEKKLFLDPSLSLESLASSLGISAGYLSFLINNYGSSNFSDYINQFRVHQAKQLIVEPEYSNYTIVSIGLESGFNSKSTFYKSFKKFTNLTPAEFIKSQS